MARISVKSSVHEDAAFYAQWQAFAADLRSAGHEVEGVGRSGQFTPLPGDLPDPLTVVITLWVGKKVVGAAVDSLVSQVVTAAGKHLKGRLAGHKRTVQIVDGDGNVLRVVEVEEDPASDWPARKDEA
jgi:hypothetical protein